MKILHITFASTFISLSMMTSCQKSQQQDEITQTVRQAQETERMIKEEDIDEVLAQLPNLVDEKNYALIKPVEGGITLTIVSGQPEKPSTAERKYCESLAWSQSFQNCLRVHAALHHCYYLTYGHPSGWIAYSCV